MFRLTSHYHYPENPAAFLEHYRSTHAVLVAKMPGLRAFGWGLAEMPDGSKPPHYLITVADWDSKDDLVAAMDSPEGQAAAEDVPNLHSSGVDVNFHEVIQLV
jgi:uncharacterized protein (TIGR02118 family)